MYIANAVTVPGPMDDFKTANCPICWDDVEQPGDWRVFACGHGTCGVCHGKLITTPGPASNCPMCRTPLVTCIVPGQPPSIALRAMSISSVHHESPSRHALPASPGLLSFAQHVTFQVPAFSAHTVSAWGLVFTLQIE